MHLSDRSSFAVIPTLYTCGGNWDCASPYERFSRKSTRIGKEVLLVQLDSTSSSNSQCKLCVEGYLFGAGRVQEKIWRKLRNAFRDHLREWWLNSLVDPYEALKTGVWQALLKLTVDDLSVVMGGTPQYERVKELLLDEDAEVIGQWVKRIKRNMMQGVDQQQPERMFPQKQSPRRGKSTKQQAGKTATNEGSDSTVRGAPADDTQVAFNLA